MFLPGEPGRRLVLRLLGWVRNRRLRLFAIYCMSLVAAIGGAFGVTAIKPSPDHSFGFLGRSCCHIIFAGRHKRA
jgi:hypothetical protein